MGNRDTKEALTSYVQDKMVTSKLEVLVDSPDQTTIDKTLVELNNTKDIIDVKFKDGAFMVETTLPNTIVLDTVARVSGKRTVLQGFGDTKSAVAMMTSAAQSVMGVIRFLQADEGPLLADGTLTGLEPGEHGLHVHETGDLSQGFSSMGGHYNPLNTPHGGPEDPPSSRHAGDLGNITADESGRATFRIVDKLLNVNDIIGRTVAVTERGDDYGKGSSGTSKIDGDSGPPIAYGIIARSATIFENPKRICMCDGVVVWDERDRPLAGKGRGDEKLPPKKCCQSENDGSTKKTCCKV